MDWVSLRSPNVWTWRPSKLGRLPPGGRWTGPGTTTVTLQSTDLRPGSSSLWLEELPITHWSDPVRFPDLEDRILSRFQGSIGISLIDGTGGKTQVGNSHGTWEVRHRRRGRGTSFFGKGVHREGDNGRCWMSSNHLTGRGVRSVGSCL